MKQNTQNKGTWAEQQACAFLESQGLRIETKNYRSHYGEIDLIMREQDLLIFVEVRFRKENDHGSGIETITHSKKNKIIKTALCYLQEQQLLNNICCRFDVVGIEEQTDPVWIKNAFEVQY